MANSVDVSLQPLESDSYPAGGPIDDYAVLNAPGRTIYAKGSEGTLNEAKLAAPGRVLVARGGATAYLNAPPRSYSLAGTVTVVGRVDHTHKPGSIVASGLHGQIGSAELTGVGRSLFAHGGGFAKLTKKPGTTSASATQGTVGRAEIYVPDRSISATGSQGTVGRAYLKAPVGRTLWGVARELRVPGRTLHATGYPVVAPAHRAYAVNLANGAITEYSNFDFDYVVRYQGRYYGLGSGGIVLLEGASDLGTNIDAELTLHATDFGAQEQKRLPYVYVGTRLGATNQMQVSVAPDEGTFRSALTTRQHRNRRAQLPRGLKARYWTIKIENQGGSDFDIDTIEPVLEVLRRKL